MTVNIIKALDPLKSQLQVSFGISGCSVLVVTALEDILSNTAVRTEIENALEILRQKAVLDEVMHGKGILNTTNEAYEALPELPKNSSDVADEMIKEIIVPSQFSLSGEEKVARTKIIEEYNG